MKIFCRNATHRFFDDDRFHISAKQLFHLSAHGLIAGHQRDRHAKIASKRRVHTVLAHFDAVEPHTLHFVGSVVRVIEIAHR